jgi:adhesin transport system membrane fusion protein
VTRATGRIIPSAKLQVVQNLEGGVVTEILAKQGQRVDAGARLVALSTVQHDADRQTRFQQLLGLEARAARLRGQATGEAPTFSPLVLSSAPDLVQVETAAYQSKLAEHVSLLSALQAQLEQRQRELQEVDIGLTNTLKALELGREERATVARLVERGLEPRLELVRIDRSLTELEARAQAAPVTLERVRSSIAEINSRIDAAKGQFRAEAFGELNRTVADLNALKQSMPALVDKVARAEIKAPMNGVVNRVFVNTVGGVVKPGDPIVEIVPADDQLVVEALVLPKDIGFTKLGQRANVKITAYDYSIFGAMHGTVVNISADAVPNEKGEAFYLVKIETDTPVIMAIDKKLPILPGMQAQVDIITGKKTILQFLSKPLVGLKENAFRER